VNQTKKKTRKQKKELFKSLHSARPIWSCRKTKKEKISKQSKRKTTEQNKNESGAHLKKYQKQILTRHKLKQHNCLTTPVVTLPLLIPGLE
jgi:hypothetical protein